MGEDGSGGEWTVVAVSTVADDVKTSRARLHVVSGDVQGYGSGEEAVCSILQPLDDNVNLAMC